MPENRVILERRFVPKGAIVMNEGEDANCAFLIQSGSVCVYTLNQGEKVELARLGVGQIFGEMALAFEEPRTASVEVLEDCNLIVITRRAFEQKLEQSDPTVQALVKMLARRVMTSNNTIVNKKDSIEDLTDGVNVIYENVITSLPRNQRRIFQESVVPKMDEFLNAVRAFKDRFE